MSSRNGDCARRACSVLAVSSGRASTSSGTTAVAASATPHVSSGLRRTLDVGNAAPARLLTLALPDAPRGSLFICFSALRATGPHNSALRANAPQDSLGDRFCLTISPIGLVLSGNFPIGFSRNQFWAAHIAVRKSCAGGFSLSHQKMFILLQHVCLEFAPII